MARAQAMDVQGAIPKPFTARELIAYLGEIIGRVEGPVITPPEGEVADEFVPPLLHRVDDRAHSRRAALEPLPQEALSVQRACDHDVAVAVQPALDQVEGAVQRSLAREEAVVDHFIGHAALKVEHHWHAKQIRQQSTDQRALVDVAVDEIWPESHCRRRRPQEQHHVQDRLAARRTDLGPADERQSECADGGDASDVPPAGVGGDEHLAAGGPEGPALLQDSHVAAAVREVVRRRDHQDAVRPPAAHAMVVAWPAEARGVSVGGGQWRLRSQVERTGARKRRRNAISSRKALMITFGFAPVAWPASRGRCVTGTSTTR